MADETAETSSPSEPTGEKKKGLSALAWVGIGCGVLVVLGFLVMSAGTWFAAKKIKEVAGDFEDNPARSAAEFLVKMNPDLELVESDDEEGTITVRQKSTGETASFDYSQIEDGQLKFEAGGEEFSLDVAGGEEDGVLTVTTDEGEARFGAATDLEDLPSWIPLIPGASALEATYSVVTDDAASGMVTMKADQDVDSVFEFYRSELESEGYEVNVSRVEVGGNKGGTLVAANSETKSSVNVVLAQEGEMTQVTIQYNGKP